LFLLAFLALLSMDQVLLVCLAPLMKGRGNLHAREMHMGKWIAQAWDAIVTFGDPNAPSTVADRPRGPAAAPTGRLFLSLPGFALLLFATAAILQTAVSCYAWNVVGPFHAVERRAEALAATDMPASLCGLNKVDFVASERNSGNPEGPHSRTYKYRSDDGTTYTVSFDFPFSENWHELTNCYRGIGWELAKRQENPLVDAESKESWGFVDGDFTKTGGDLGAVWFADFDQFGKPVESVSDWDTRQITSWDMRQEYLQPRRVYQVQIWVASTHELTPEQRQKARELLLASRAHFRAAVTGATAGETNASPGLDQAAPKATEDANTVPVSSSLSK
jgi:hypothetical protein